jgi:hypothetical protein
MDPLFEMEEQLCSGQGKGVAAFLILRLYLEILQN